MPELLTTDREDFEALFAEAMFRRGVAHSYESMLLKLRALGIRRYADAYPEAFAFACKEMGIPVSIRAAEELDWREAA